MYYKGMWEKLRENMRESKEYLQKSNDYKTFLKNKTVDKNKLLYKITQSVINEMDKIEEEFSDYGDMNKYCVECGKPMRTIKGKYGYFRGCSNFPKCNYHEFYREFGKIVDNKSK